MKIIIDNKIPFIKDVFEPFATVFYIRGSDITNNLLLDADALVVRTRTLVTEELLQGTKVKFVGTATIGTDHIDTRWCENNDVYWTSAPGCNSGSVMQYIASALAYLQKKNNIIPTNTTLGIIGVGNVGSKVAKLSSGLGFNILLNDPPRQKTESNNIFCSLDSLLSESDIVSIHVPLNRTGDFETLGMVDKSFIARMKSGSILINTSRGPIINEPDLLTSYSKGHPKGLILDVWQNEPVINRELLDVCQLATPHIAGYSVDGKANGTTMIVNKLAKHFNLPLQDWKPSNLPTPEYTNIEPSDINDAILRTYPIEEDSERLKNLPERFEEQRGNYRIRREFGAYTIKTDDLYLMAKLKEIGFRT